MREDILKTFLILAALLAVVMLVNLAFSQPALGI